MGSLSHKKTQHLPIQGVHRRTPDMPNWRGTIRDRDVAAGEKAPATLPAELPWVWHIQIGDRMAAWGRPRPRRRSLPFPGSGLAGGPSLNLRSKWFPDSDSWPLPSPS